jgi:hypothetical protein
VMRCVCCVVMRNLLVPDESPATIDHENASSTAKHYENQHNCHSRACALQNPQSTNTIRTTGPREGGRQQVRVSTRTREQEKGRERRRKKIPPTYAPMT